MLRRPFLVTEAVEAFLNYIEIRSGEDGVLGCMCDECVYMPPGSGKLCAAGGWLPRLCMKQPIALHER